MALRLQRQLAAATEQAELNKKMLHSKGESGRVVNNFLPHKSSEDEAKRRIATCERQLALREEQLRTMKMELNRLVYRNQELKGCSAIGQQVGPPGGECE